MNLPAHLHPVLDLFHPAVATWFRQRFATVTEAQAGAWPLIHAGQSMLLAAPTGSGKTLSAFLAVLDELFRQGLEHGGELPAHTQVVYVSPLKALSNDIRLNLDAPLEGISQQIERLGMQAPRITTAVRTGDTPQKERAAMRKLAPHILVTTPESLYVLMGSASGREGLANVHTVIVDEIHALAGNKRGSHLALTLERLQALTGRPLRRIGLSATQRPVERVAQFLVGHERPCAIVDIGHARQRDLALELPPVPLGAVMATDVWDLVYDRLAALAREHRTTLVFVNTRRLAERLSRHLGERLGNEAVAAHHGSLAKEHRLAAEQRLKAGELQVLVATASLELGIDIGEVDLVCQIASPGSIAAFLQRVGRSGHQVDGIPKGRLFPTSRDELIECVALLDCVRQGELDTLHVPRAPLDVLAQQIVAEVSNQPWNERALFDLLRQATPYAELDEGHYQALLRMLAEGYNGRQGVRGAYLHRDAVNGSLRGRRGSQLTALTSGGTIPETADYAVLLEPQALNIGSVNEDFAVESIAGDIFQLGNASYRILRVEPGRVRVEDAHGLPPTIPFWLGEAPGRSDELSAAVARLQQRIDQQLQAGDGERVSSWLQTAYALDDACASQLLDYLGRTWQVLGALPSQQTLVMERFFDESGGTQLIIHSPHGSRINRAWGLALRKRFCRTFNFELQAAASEDAIVLSLSTSHSFELEEVWRYLNSRTAEPILVQALLDAPLFGVRWRWNAAVAMALPRYVGGRKVAPQIQRMKSEDLVAAVFPDQIACLENIVGERQIPDHPLVEQTLDDCLHEAMDSEGWLALLRRMENGEVRLLSRDLPTPSPLASAILNARPYAFLDDAPLEERRTQAVLNRRWNEVHSADDLGALDADAIAAVQAEAWPRADTADEMHEALMGLGAITCDEVEDNGAWQDLLRQLASSGRACCLDAGGQRLWLARERLQPMLTLYPDARLEPDVPVLAGFDDPCERDTALTELLRARLSGFGPLTLPQITEPLALAAADTEQALARLEGEGYVMRGHFSPGQTRLQWCERHLLARIHRYTVKRLRQEIEPVSLQDYLRFLCDWQHLSGDTRLRGPQAVAEVLAQLQGFPAAAGAWESDLLPARIKDYSPHWLDDACRSGLWTWSRLAATVAASTLSSTPLVLLPREQLGLWRSLAPAPDLEQLGARAQRVLRTLQEQGALFFDELTHEAHLLPSELESALQELVGAGLASADGFSGLRSLITPAARRSSRNSRRGHPPLSSSMVHAGRWALLRRTVATDDVDQRLEHVARSLLRRYGVVCWRLLERESDVLPAWRDLLRCYHRLEARGEIRGGRFIAGLAGEQFALPEAVGLLRQVRRRSPQGELVVVSGCDPLNLVGTLLPGTRVPAVAGNRVLYREGVAVATRVAGKYQFLVDTTATEQAQWRQHLLRGTPAL
ncbi:MULTISPECIES: DEAD/DEAH box helicase [unclassified Pseudomonas]|uniref:DEAD/DEAH box helicase n=1 Tax=unclassified Pseudomonas TaxID=196821 RepID=UPI00244BFF0C|nr:MULTISPECIES: DEAD/DEAH box helicase [unclassified Pseudomonas]MDH0303957.1 DEAD/DEAH box helicase [Pseudomonas sp. GD04091]MDH1987349.1 DEAD/DEAH box helicase [Pseudomonas sp. GD03689]